MRRFRSTSLVAFLLALALHAASCSSDSDSDSADAEGTDSTEEASGDSGACGETLRQLPSSAFEGIGRRCESSAVPPL